MHNPLDRNLRNKLETAVGNARECAEAAAREAIHVLGVSDPEAPGHLAPEERALRVRLRAHARQLGDALTDSRQAVDSLVEEVAYEHWHRMLFARFLAENDLLIYDGVAITLADCAELAEEEHCASPWELAARCAAKMLPQIFRLDSPSFELEFAPDRVRELERLLAGLDAATFKASDALGWLYQFWQSQKKKQVNESEVKIGAKELPAVTQLFTEPYMVAFLLDNSLGAWYAVPKLAGKTFESEADARAFVSMPEIPLKYLRLIQNEDKTWTPAGGTFDQWPKTLSEFTLLDPCCGSGHFLVSSFLMLVPMRMELESLDAKTAVERVLAENIHGLELDQRCVELAAFALALEAWRYPAVGGYRALPSFHLACDGVAPQMRKEQWIQLARRAARHITDSEEELIATGDESLWENQLVTAMEKLYVLFKDAPVLGSLINPVQLDADLFQANFADVVKILHDNLSHGNAEEQEAVIAAHGIIKAMELLSRHYTLVITNVPYLARGKQETLLADFCEKTDKEAKNDLATVFLNRCLDFNTPGGSNSVVLPQNWLFLTSYKKFREKLLKNKEFDLLARLGAGAFETISGEVVKAILITLSNCNAGDAHALRGLDVSEPHSAEEKAALLLSEEIKFVLQNDQLKNPDARIGLEPLSEMAFLSQYSTAYQGISPADFLHYGRFIWELPNIVNSDWKLWQSTVYNIEFYNGKSLILWFNSDLRLAIAEGRAFMRGEDAQEKNAITISQMRKLPCTLHRKTYFDTNCAVIIPNDVSDLPAIWCYCSSPEYNLEVRKIDQKLNVTNATLGKVPFDLEHWTKMAQEKYPHGLPEPFTDDPTQWIFHGHPCASVVWDETEKRLAIAPDRVDATVLHVAVARLLGYRWPAELDPEMELAPEMREVMKRLDALLPLADEDGVVCLPAIRGEESAAARVSAMLQAAYGGTFTADTLNHLLAACDCAGKTLEYWLREKFFAQHAKLFGNRPFIWQVWDGLRDGFSVLVNYHKLDNKTLQNLIYNYLGDWITRQKSDIANGVDGAQEKLDAAETLKKKLLLILEGEAPYDIFVRWKPLAEQPVCWNPDLNDGVRLNIRPFVTAGVLRAKLNIKWDKDRGKDVASAPWYSLFRGDRINDHHLTLAEKTKNRNNGAASNDI